MTRKTIKTLIKEINSIGPKQNYPTNNTDVYRIDDIWSLDIIDLKGYGHKNNHNYRYVLLVIDNSSKFGWTESLKNKYSQTGKTLWKIFLYIQKENQI